MANELIPPILMTTASALSGLVYGWRRRSAGGKAALAAGCSVWSGTQVLIFMVPHTVVSTTMRLLGKTKAMSLVNTKIFGVEYDFRLYSLALVGIVFVLQAISILRASRAASDSELAASKRVRRAIGNVLLLAMPLAPISPGIPFLTVPAVFALGTQYLLFAGGRRCVVSHSQTQAATV